jgi:hypothetical protein
MLQYGLISSSSSAPFNCWSWNSDDSPASTSCSAEYNQIQASHSSYSSSANSITEANAWLAFTLYVHCPPLFDLWSVIAKRSILESHSQVFFVTWQFESFQLLWKLGLRHPTAHITRGICGPACKVFCYELCQDNRKTIETTSLQTSSSSLCWYWTIKQY